MARPSFSQHEPLIVTLRSSLSVLRDPIVFAALRTGIQCASSSSFRVVEFSVQADHVHLICEATDAVALSRGMAGLSIRLARAANHVLGRAGRFWASRYHAKSLKTPSEVREALVYVLHDRKPQGPRANAVDEMSSAAWFGGWKDSEAMAKQLRAARGTLDPATRPPETWLLSVGWKSLGLLSVNEAPRG